MDDFPISTMPKGSSHDLDCNFSQIELDFQRDFLLELWDLGIRDKNGIIKQRSELELKNDSKILPLIFRTSPGLFSKASCDRTIIHGADAKAAIGFYLSEGHTPHDLVGVLVCRIESLMQ
jgi:hypothetical protein